MKSSMNPCTFNAVLWSEIYHLHQGVMFMDAFVCLFVCGCSNSKNNEWITLKFFVGLESKN